MLVRTKRHSALRVCARQGRCETTREGKMGRETMCPGTGGRNSGRQVLLPRGDSPKMATPQSCGVGNPDILRVDGSCLSSRASLHCTHHERKVSREERISSWSHSCRSFPSRGNILQRYINECSKYAQQMLTSSICRYCVQGRTGLQDETALMVTETGECLRRHWRRIIGR